MAAALQPGDLMGQQLRIAAIPAIADQQHHSASTQYTPGPIVIKILQRGANARAAGPILDCQRNFFHGFVYVTVPQLASDARQTGAENKGFQRTL